MLKKVYKKNIFKIICMALTLAFVINVSSAYAYTLELCYWVGTSPIPISYKWGSNLQTPGTVCRNGFENAISSWNSSQSKLSYFYYSTSSNVLNTEYVNDDLHYGYCYISYELLSGRIYYFEADINALNSHISETNVAQSAACHELGHSLGLDHSTYTSIMNTERTRSVIYTPQIDDINGINAGY